MGDVRRTVLYYGEWMTRIGRFRRLADGFEIWVGAADFGSRVRGVVGKKRIADDSIAAIFTTCGMVRIVFDHDDELILRQEVLDDFPQAVLDRIGVRWEEPPASTRWWVSSAQVYIDQMRARQRLLGLVSFKAGRRRPRPPVDPPWT